MREVNNRSLVLCLLFSLFFSFHSMATACGSFGFHNYQRANKRACFANQRTLAGALEMYNLDMGTYISELTPESLNTLLNEGYLQSIPDDPGFERGTSSNYFVACNGMICCLNHGFINQETHNLDQNASAYDQLMAIGENREEILSRASRKPSNTAAPEAQLRDNIATTNSVLISFTPFVFIFWLPLSIWRLKEFRRGQKYKLAALATGWMGLFCQGINSYPFFNLSFILIQGILFLDMLIFAIRMLFTKGLITEMVTDCYTGFSKLTEINLKKVKATFHKATIDHERLLKVMKTVAFLTCLSAIPWISSNPWMPSRQTDSEALFWFLTIVTICFVLGAMSGVVRFSNSVKAAHFNSNSDGTIPVIRNILITLLFAYPILLSGRVAAQSAVSAWPYASLPLIFMTAIFGGRSLAANRLNRRFLLLLHNLPYIQLPEAKKHCSAAGISAHPGRMTCSTLKEPTAGSYRARGIAAIYPYKANGTDGKTNGIYGETNGTMDTDELEVMIPLPEARLSLEDATCPVCGEGFTDVAWVCNDCNTPHHRDCWEFNSECTTFGCNSKKASIHQM